MGAWGIGILQNDTTSDVWAEFKQLYNLGSSPIEIRKKLEKEYDPENDEDEYADFWTGIAHGQWMCGELENYTLIKLKKAIDEGKGMALWKETAKDYKKRLQAIEVFIQKIAIPREKPLKRKKIILCPAFFDKGDVISYQFDNGKIAHGLVVDAEGDEIDGGNKIVFTSLVTQHPISASEFMKSEILYLDEGGNNGYFRGYFWASFQARNMKRKINKCKVLTNIQFKDYLGIKNSVPYGDWNNIEKLYIEQEEFLKIKKTGKPKQLLIENFINGKNKELESELTQHANKLHWDKLEQMNLGYKTSDKKS